MKLLAHVARTRRPATPGVLAAMPPEPPVSTPDPRVRRPRVESVPDPA